MFFCRLYLLDLKKNKIIIIPCIQILLKHVADVRYLFTVETGDTICKFKLKWVNEEGHSKKDLMMQLVH